MANGGFKYRVVDSSTGDVVSSAEGCMTFVNKKGEIVVFNTIIRKMVFGAEFKGLHVELATHRHNGRWVFQKAEKKDTYSVWYKVKKFLKSIRALAHIKGE